MKDLKKKLNEKSLKLKVKGGNYLNYEPLRQRLMEKLENEMFMEDSIYLNYEPLRQRFV